MRMTDFAPMTHVIKLRTVMLFSRKETKDRGCILRLFSYSALRETP